MTIAAAAAYILLSIETGAITASHWPDPARPVSFGSLVKPFTALAYAQSHGFQYPVVECRRCWSGRVHGRIGIAEAVALSCNSYFAKLAGGVDAAPLASLAARFGLPGPARNSTESWLGMGDGWQATPAAILEAYVELWRRRSEPGIGEIIRGFERSAISGTGKGIRLAALTKTGTAPCSHTPHAPGDGYAIALYPKDSPRTAVLVQVHSRPGAHAAIIAGELLRGAAKASGERRTHVTVLADGGL